MGIKLFIKPQAIGFVRRGFVQKILTRYAVNHVLSFRGVTLVLLNNGGRYIFHRQTLPGRGVSPAPVHLKLQFFLPGNTITSSLHRTTVILQSTTLLQPVNAPLWADAQSGFRVAHNKAPVLNKLIHQGQWINSGGSPAQPLKPASNIRYTHQLGSGSLLAASQGFSLSPVGRLSSPSIMRRSKMLPPRGVRVNHLVYEHTYLLREAFIPGTRMQRAARAKPYTRRMGSPAPLRSKEQGEAYRPKAMSGLELAKLRLYALRGHGTADPIASNDQGEFHRDVGAPGLQLAKASPYVLRPRSPAAFSRTDQSEPFYSHKSAPRMDLTKPGPFAGEPVVKDQEQVVTGPPSGQVAVSRTAAPQVDVNKLANQVYQEIERRLKLERSRRGR